MKVDTIEELKKDLERLEAITQALPELPPKFVKPAMAWALIERCKPAQQFALKYTQLCNGANEILPISKEQAKWLRSFETYAELIRQSIEQWPRTYGIGLEVVISTILADNKSEHKEDAYVYVKRLFQGFKLIDLTLTATHFDKPEPMSDEEFEKEYEKIKEVL